MQWNNWSEFYRSAVLTSSELLMKVKKRLPIIQERKYRLKHVYLGINSDDDYHEIEIVCTDFSLDLGADEFILHDDFDWLYEK
jgi:hypothetical protein